MSAQRRAAQHPPAPLAYLFLSFASLTWAGNIVLARAVHAEMPPVSLGFWRWATALLILLPFTLPLLVRQRTAIRREWRFLTLLGLTGMAGFHTLQYTALNATTAINAALINAVCPAVIPLFALLIRGDRLTLWQGVGIVVSFAGVSAIVMRGDPLQVLAQGLAAGDAIMLVAMLIWSFYVTMVSRRPDDLHPNTLLVASIIPAVVVLFPLWIWEITVIRPMPVAPDTFIVIGYIGVFAGVLAYLGYTRSVPAVGPTRAGLFLHLIPLFAALLAMIFLGEELRLFHLAGAAAIICGLYLTTASGRRVATGERP